MPLPSPASGNQLSPCRSPTFHGWLPRVPVIGPAAPTGARVVAGHRTLPDQGCVVTPHLPLTRLSPTAV